MGIGRKEMGIPGFHTFREAMECIESGGAAYRYGSFYPLYAAYAAHSGCISRHFDGGSGGEMVDMMRGADFTPDQQASTNWVLFTKEEWDARQINYMERCKEFYEMEAWREQMHRNNNVLRKLFAGA